MPSTVEWVSAFVPLSPRQPETDTVSVPWGIVAVGTGTEVIVTWGVGDKAGVRVMVPVVLRSPVSDTQPAASMQTITREKRLAAFIDIPWRQ